MWASSLKHFPVCVAEGVDACGPCCPGSLASQFSGMFCPVEVAGEMEAEGMKKLDHSSHVQVCPRRRWGGWGWGVWSLEAAAFPLHSTQPDSSWHQLARDPGPRTPQRRL